MYNSPHHPEFTHHYGKLIEMATERNLKVSLSWYPRAERWHVKIEPYWPVTAYDTVNRNVLSEALEAAIEHLAGVPVCK